MPQTLPNTTSPAHRLSLEQVTPRMAKVAPAGEAKDLKDLEAEGRRDFGRVLERCIKLANLNSEQAARRLGLDPAQLSRWIAGTENVQCWRLHQDDVLGPALIAAQAEATDSATVETVITLAKVGS